MAVVTTLSLTGVAHAALFVQPTNITYSAASSINTPDALIGDVTSETDSHPNPSGGGGGTSWYSTTWSGEYLSFDFAAPSRLLSFHLWDYYDHTAENVRLVLYDGLGATGNIVLDQNFSFNPNRGGSQFSLRHDFTFASPAAGVESGRLYPLTDFSGSFPNFGLAEIGFTIPEPSAALFLLPAAFACAVVISRRRHKSRLR